MFLTEFYLSTREFPGQPSIKHVLVHAEDGLVYSNLFYRQRVFIGPENHLLSVSSGGTVMNQSHFKCTNTEAPR